VKVIQSKMRFQVVEMTPEYAQELLDKNHPNNRPAKKSRIEQYERDMRAGMWRLTHQPVAQDEDGYLVDGQNRLSAVVRSGQNVPMVLCLNVPRDAILGADCGAIRNVGDAAKISGNPLPHGSNGYASVARAMARGVGATKQFLSIQATLEFIDAHKSALEFAYQVINKNTRMLAQAPVRAAIARAYYKRNSRARIREFGEVYLSGLCGNTKTDVAAIRLRNWILDTMGSRRGGNRPNARTIYAKTSTALKHFIDRNPVDSLRETNEELFPLESDETEFEGNGQANGAAHNRLAGVN
jgi:hypothetical protein